MIWANGYDGDLSSGYSFAVPSSDFIVTLGKWHDGDGGTDSEKVGTFAHELGHISGSGLGGGADLRRYNTVYWVNSDTAKAVAARVRSIGIKMGESMQSGAASISMPTAR